MIRGKLDRLGVVSLCAATDAHPDATFPKLVTDAGIGVTPYAFSEDRIEHHFSVRLLLFHTSSCSEVSLFK